MPVLVLNKEVLRTQLKNNSPAKTFRTHISLFREGEGDFAVNSN